MNNIEFVNDREREYFARAKLGSDIEDFLRSDAGRYLHGRAKLELEECKNAALDCNPLSIFGRRKLTKIQQKAATAQAFLRWCAEAIQDGRAAERELQP